MVRRVLCLGGAAALALVLAGAVGAVSYVKTVVVDLGTVGLGQQQDKEARRFGSRPCGYRGIH